MHMCTHLEPPYGRGAHARPRGEAGDPPPAFMSEQPAKPPIAPAASKAAGFPACGLTLTLNHSEACGLTLTPALHLTAQERECERCGRTVRSSSKPPAAFLTEFDVPPTQADLTAHAEIVAIREAGRLLKLEPGSGGTLEGYSMLVLADPCPMCMGAMLWAKLDAVDFLFHRDDVEPYENPNLGKLYAPRFRNKRELYDQVACCTTMPLGFYREAQRRALAIYERWSIC